MIAVLCGPLRISAVLWVQKRLVTQRLQRYAEKQKAQPGPPACPPLHQPSVFPGYLIYIFNTSHSPEKFQKKFLEQAWGLFQNHKGALKFGLYRDRSPNVAATDTLTLVAHWR
jgi:hypothetical protein